MLSGTTSVPEMCQPAWSSIRTAWAPGATAALISARCSLHGLGVAEGHDQPGGLALSGQIAPKI